MLTATRSVRNTAPRVRHVPAAPAAAPTFSLALTAQTVTAFGAELAATLSGSPVGGVTVKFQRSAHGAGSWSDVRADGPDRRYVESGLSASGDYDFRPVGTDHGNGTTFTGNTVRVQTRAAASAGVVNTFPAAVTAAAAKVSGNTQQAQDFKTYLDANLDAVYEEQYQAGNMGPAVADFALGHLLYKGTNATQANKYADKAIALAKHLTRSDLGVLGQRLILGRGNGSQTAFTVPDADFRPSTLRVYVAPTSVKTFTKGAAFGQDSTGRDPYNVPLKVSNTSDGPADYVQGTDWRVCGEYLSGTIDWAPAAAGGTQPAVGATYYVTVTGPYFVSAKVLNTDYTVSGATVTMATPPTSSQVVHASYLCGASGYEQPVGYTGGYANIYTDSGYTSRNLRYVLNVLDWLWDYAGLTNALKQEFATMALRWYQWTRDNGYMTTHPESNYEDGHYALQTLLAAAFIGRVDEAAACGTEMAARRTANVLPVLAAPVDHGTHYQGMTSEGWSYGTNAYADLLMGSVTLKEAGLVASVTQEAGWAADAIKAYLHGKPTTTLAVSVGDWSGPYQDPIGTWRMLSLAGYVSSDATAAANGRYWQNNYSTYTAAQHAAHDDLLFRDAAGAATNWTGTYPLGYRSRGVELVTARKDWTYATPWWWFICGNLTSADHQAVAAGALGAVFRGADELIADAAFLLADGVPSEKSSYSNLVACDTNGDTAKQRYAFNQYFSYGWGAGDVSVTGYDEATAYTYVAGDSHNAYLYGGSTFVSKLTRDVLYARAADLLFVFDRATTTAAAYKKRLQWHTKVNPTVTGDALTATVGGSGLRVDVFSSAALTTTKTALASGYYRMGTLPTSDTAGVVYESVLQVGASGFTPATAARIPSSDGVCEGAICGDVVAVFGTAAGISGNCSYAYTGTNAHTITHYVLGVQASHTYTLGGAASGTPTSSAGGVLTFTTAANGASQTVTVTA